MNSIPGCVPAQTCESCVEASRVSAFECGWCPRLSRYVCMCACVRVCMRACMLCVS
jgi:hypothetical protein